MPEPLAGLRELRRVVKADGHVLLLEHVRPEGRFGAWLADTFAWFTREALGDEWNRRTEESIRAVGLAPVEVRREGIWREIVSRPAAAG